MEPARCGWGTVHKAARRQNACALHRAPMSALPQNDATGWIVATPASVASSHPPNDASFQAPSMNPNLPPINIPGKDESNRQARDLVRSEKSDGKWSVRGQHTPQTSPKNPPDSPKPSHTSRRHTRNDRPNLLTSPAAKNNPHRPHPSHDSLPMMKGKTSFRKTL